jgi:hypothetical protein
MQIHDRDLAGCLRYPDEIAKAIADQLQAKRLPRRKDRASSLLTYGIRPLQPGEVPSLDGCFSVTPNTIELLDEAVKRDPSFFDAMPACRRARRGHAVSGSDHTPPGSRWPELLFKPQHGYGRCCRNAFGARAISLLRAARLCRRAGRIGERAQNFTE